MARIIQPSFARGEIAPDLFGRVDARAYQLGLKRARNAIIHSYGGFSNRPGTIFIGPVKDHTKTPRLIPFQFSTTDTHVLEFGHEYIRIIRNDAHVTEATKTVTSVSQTDPVVVTVSGSHGYSNGDEVFLSAIGGMTEITERRWKVTSTGASTFSLQDQVTGLDVDGTGFTAYTSGGTSARVYTVVSPYQQEELRSLKFVQTADVMTITHPNHPPKELRRSALTTWTLADISFEPEIDYPPTITATGGTGADGSYKVTAIADNNEESLAAIGLSYNITAITNADPGQVTTSGAHGLQDGDEVAIFSVGGMTELNDRRFVVTNASGSTFDLLGEDTTNWGTYTSGGTVYRTFVRHTDNTNVTIAWTAVDGAVRYRVFKLDQGVYGYIASTEGTSYLDTGSVTPDISDTPPRLVNPFFGEDNYPAAVGFHQQRRVMGGSNNDPDTTRFSTVGVYDNFSHAVPIRADDAFSITLASRKVNKIVHYTSMRDLITFTTGEEWLVSPTGTQLLSHDTVQQSPQSNWGCDNDLAPIVIGSSILFSQDVGNVVRSLKYTFQKDSYTSDDLSLLSSHMLKGYSILEWGGSAHPEPRIYMVRDDGQLLTLTYNEEQELIAWTTWDTFGLYESVTVNPPSTTDKIDQVFMVVNRTINGNTVRYIERTHRRIFSDVRDAFFVDCGLTYDYPYDIESIATDDPVEITITGHPFTNGDEVDIYDVVWQLTLDSKGNATYPQHLNTRRYTVANATADTFTLQDKDGNDIDGTEFAVYVGGGTVRKAVQSISGLWFLPNTPVAVLADGNVVTGITVDTNGIINLPRKFSRIHVGLSYITDMETLDPEPDANRTKQGLQKKISNVTVKFDKSRGLLLGPSSTMLTEMKQRENEDWGEPTELLSGDKQVTILPTWKTNGRLFLRQIYPLPMTILAIVPDIEIGDE